MYNKLNAMRVSIVDQLLLVPVYVFEDRYIDDVAVNFFTLLLSKWGKNKRVAHKPLGECFTECSYMESVC